MLISPRPPGPRASQSRCEQNRLPCLYFKPFKMSKTGVCHVHRVLFCHLRRAKGPRAPAQRAGRAARSWRALGGVEEGLEVAAYGISITLLLMLLLLLSSLLLSSMLLLS